MLFPAVKRLGLAYGHALATNRLPVSTVSGAVLALLGDAAAQQGQMLQIAASADNNATASDSGSTTMGFDTKRMLAFTIFGAILTGPINYVWLNTSHRWTARLAPGGGLAGMLCKIGLQTVIMQPLIYLPCFYTVNAILRPAEWPFERIRKEYPTTYVKLAFFWLPFITYAFGVLPLHQQAVFMGGVGLTWNVILSLIANPLKARSAGRKKEL